MTFFAFVKLWHQQANIFFSIFKRRLVPLFFLKSFEKNEGRKTFYFRPSLLEEIEWSSLQNKQLIYVNQKKAKSFVVDRSKESMEMEFYAYPSRVFPLTSSICSFCIRDLVDRAKDFISVAVSAIIGSVLSAVFTFFFALVGTLLGALTGALIGQETESGFVRGAAVGAISGAVFSLEVFESSLLLWQSDESGITCLVYLIDVLTSLLSGRLVRERIGPAMLSAVQSQMGAVELAYDEVPNIFDTGVAKGLHGDSVEKIPKIVITKGNNLDGSGERVSCSVCLQDFQLGETVRCLPQCHHMFHLPCIDTWLLRHGSCPMCRRDL